MILVESIVGNINDANWKKQLEGATLDFLNLDQWQAQKNRFRLSSDAGAELAISLDRNSHLHDGDIVVWDAGDAHGRRRPHSASRGAGHPVLRIAGPGEDALLRTCFELGHALGNQHWPAIVKGTKIFVPLTVDRKVMASVMKTHAFAGITYEFLPGTEVIPFPRPARIQTSVRRCQCDAAFAHPRTRI